MPYRSEALAGDARRSARTPSESPEATPSAPPLGRNAWQMTLLGLLLGLGVSALALMAPARPPTLAPISDARSSTPRAPLPPPPPQATPEAPVPGGYVAPSDSTRRALVRSDSLFGVAAGAECVVRFASGSARCTTQIRCGARLVYDSGDLALDCRHSYADVVTAWDLDARLSISFGTEHAMIFDGVSAALVLDLTTSG
jgi:hypothetical protein